MSQVILMNDYHSIFEGDMAGMQSIKAIVLLSLLFLIGCSDPVEEQIANQLPSTIQRVEQLSQELAKGNVRNAVLIQNYANTLIEKKPHLTPLIEELKKDATDNGPLYQSLLRRIDTIRTTPEQFPNRQAIFEELLNIFQAADPTLYSDALSDPLNVLADMSDGELPRVNALSKAQSLAANGAQDFGVGEQLIGNPNYGQWQTDSSGMSFWAWYGVFSLIDDVFDYKRKKRYYSHWGKHRNYSYYSDYGRDRYSSPKQRKFQSNLETRTRKSFASKGQSFSSPYSKNRTGSSKLSRQSKSAQSSASRYSKNSTYGKKSSAKKSTYAKNASFRNSKSTTSRSFRRGK